ncbi:MAG TPA: rod shape-determining protein MreC [Alloiococcus sp.]|nr:rod shape-determining protein MreC [Alloiococcus sp.]
MNKDLKIEVRSMNRFLTNKKLIVLLISVIIFISLVTLSLSGGNNVVQGLTNDITAFVGRSFSKPADSVMTAFNSVEEIQHTFEENQVLKREIKKIYEKDAEIANLREENKQLQAELGVSDTLSEYQTVAANVISRNPDQWIENLIIDVGSDDGVNETMPVMNQNGLIGIISEANASSSKVTLITNVDESSNRVSAQINIKDRPASSEENDNDDANKNSNAVYGIISEYREETGDLVMTQVTSDLDIQEGNIVTTSGLGGLFPSGLVIGEVREVTLDNQGLGRVIFVKPATDFNNTKTVTVVNREAETILPEDFEESEEE